MLVWNTFLLQYSFLKGGENSDTTFYPFQMYEFQIISQYFLESLS